MMRFENHANGEAILAGKSLVCRRAGRQLFAGLDFDLMGGQVVALRGENGVGKTSLLRMLARLLSPFAGSLEGTLQENLHYVGHQNGLKTRLTVLENLEFWHHWLSVKGKLGMDVGQALAVAGLETHMSLIAGDLSAGQKRRLSLARLLVAPRAVWLLDEPDTALDEQGQVWLIDMIKAQRKANGLIIVATHEALAYADRQIMLMPFEKKDVA